LAFPTVAMQPGGPQGIGTLEVDGRRVPWLAFPGNPVSALLSCELIARPALGASARRRLRLPIRLEAEEPSPPAGPVPSGPGAALGAGAPGGRGLVAPAGRIRRCRRPGPGAPRHRCGARRRRARDPADPRRRDMNDLSHVRADGSAHMVDVTDKAVTSRAASARAVLRTRPDVVDRIASGDLPKGEALATARIAGIMGAKRTSDLIPLCHPLPLSGVELDLVPREDRVEITATVRTRGVTGVEMEALTAASVAALTVYDMIKAVDHLATIDGVQVLTKSGGRSGDWTRTAAEAQGLERAEEEPG